MSKFHWKIKPQIEVLERTNEQLFEVIKEEIFNPPLGPEENDYGIGYQHSRITIRVGSKV